LASRTGSITNYILKEYRKDLPSKPLLLPLQALRMSIRDTYIHYPPPQLIAAVARGGGQLPDNPELRALWSA
jgi:hypothetical protein